MRRWILWKTALSLTVLSMAACARNVRPQSPAAEPTFTVSVTAYCRGTTTAAGTAVTAGVVAADSRVFPLESRIRVSGLGRHSGIYTVMDTGPKVEGRRIDLYVSDCAEAARFGRHSARVSILRRGA